MQRYSWGPWFLGIDSSHDQSGEVGDPLDCPIGITADDNYI